MQSADAQEFTRLLASVFDAYSRPMPLPETQTLWWKLLKEFDLNAVRNAFGKFVATEKKFPPTPAEIRDFLGANGSDQRPGPDEAWAIALISRDESETVVWTSEIAEAFAACRPVLEIGDEVGARMAFKDAYTRIVSAARLRNEFPKWVASVGYDQGKREQVLRKAESAGLLPAPQVAAYLPPPEPEMTEQEKAFAREQTKKLMQMLSGATNRREEQRIASVEKQQTHLKLVKTEIDKRVRQYEGQKRGMA